MPDDADLTPGGDDLAAAYLDRYGRRERRRRGITFPDDVSTGLRPAERAEAEDRKRAVAPARLSPPEYTIDNEPPPAARRPDTVILGADGRPLPDAQQPRRLLVPDEAFPDSLERAMERLGARAPQLAPRDVTATAADARTGGLAARLASEHGAPRALALTLGLPEAAGSFAAGRVAQAVTDPLGTARAMTVGAGEDVWRGFHTGMRDVRLGDYRQAAGEFGGAALTTAMVALPALAELRAGTRLVARGMAPSGRVLAGAGDLAAAMDRTGAVGARPTPASEVPPEVRARQAVEHNFQTQADIVLAARDRGVLEESGAPQFEHALTGAHLDEVSGLFRRSGGGAHPVADLIERAKPMVAAGDPWRAAVRTVAERDPAFTPAVAEQADQALSIAATKAMPTPARAIRTPKPSDRVASPGAAPAAPSVRSTSKGNALQDFSEQLFTGGDATAHEAEARRWGATEDEIYTARAAGQMPGARHAPAPPRPTEGAPEPPPAAERITAASVRFKDGSVFTGPSHAEALDAAAAAGKNVDEATTDGFVTSHGREVGRADADAIFSGARPAGAIPFRLHAADVAVERGLPEDAGIRGAPIGPWAPGLRRGAVGDLGPGGSGSPLKREGGKPAIEHAAPTTPADIVGEEVAGVGSEDARGFPSRLYSRVGQAINDAPFEKGTAEQWRAHLKKGVPQDEVAGTGVEAMLAEQKGQPLGFAHPAVARTVAAAGAGAAVGALQGGTVEEKAKNALVGAGLGVALVAGLPPLVRRLKGPATQAFTDIYAPIREQAPELHATLHAAGAMPPVSAARFVGGLVERSLGPLPPTQRAQFGRRILLDNIEAEATRKAAAATEAEIRAGAEPLPDPTKSERGLWYSRTTAGGALRAADEMETEPLIQELHRRSDAQKVYFADTRRFGPTSAVTQRNEVAIYNIEKILEERDGLDAEVVWNEVGRRRAATPDEEATSFAFGANAPLEFPLHAPAAPVTETGIRSTVLREAADRLTAHATRLRSTLPAGLERQPWFARALAQAKMNVQGFNEAGAEGAGVDRANFRQPSLGLYMRMISQDRLNEQLIRSTQEAAAREPGSTVPRQGAALTVLGQRPTVARLTPVGATGPLQGPVNVMREKPAMRNFPPGTAATASRKMATGGARTYVEDFATAAKSDAADKVAKMQRNKVYEAVARLPGAELDPTENAPPGRRALTFNDLNQLVPAPPEGSAIPKGFRRFAVPTEVADAVDQYQRQVRGTTASGHAWRRAAGLVTRSVLLNPAAAMGHALTLASSVGTTMPADAGVIRSLASGVPVAKVATTLDRIRRVDFARQATVTRLHRLALSGALRISADESTGWIDRGHHILFGPNGIDPRARVVASEDFEAGARKAGLTTEDPAYIALERDYVTEHAGNYVGRNQGSASQFLQDYGIAPFIAINRAKYGTSLRAVVGSTGIPGASLGTRAAVVARGPVGVAAALTGAGYLLSGHSAAENAPGHETDLATGVYHLEDGGYAYFRGSPDDAAQQFGARAREVYLRKGLMDPTASAAIRLLEPIATAASGDRVSELLRASANAAMGLVGPAPGAAVGLGLGSTLYVDRDGTLGKLQGVHLEKNADLVDRLLAVTRNVNTGAALALPSTPGARSVSSSMFGNLNPFTTARAGSLPRLGIERREVEAWQQAVTSRIYAERDPTARQALMDAALEEATSAGYTGPALRAGFQRAVNRAATNRAGAAAIKFENRIRGTAPRPDAAERYMRRFGGAPAIPDYERR